jgi:peptidoglycan/LPS O-acetylase OafA/YrhL
LTAPGSVRARLPSRQLAGTASVRDNHSINALRALAALAVAIGHVRGMFFRDYAEAGVPHTAPIQALYGVTDLGHSAVIVFFVLSGFWVGGGVLAGVGRGQFKLLDYAIKRLVRLWIVLLPALLLTASLDGAGRLLFPSSSVYQGTVLSQTILPWHLDETLTLRALLGNVVFLQSLHVPPFGTNAPLWSLAYEFWYYALFPCAVIALRRSSRRSLRVTCASGFLLGCAISGSEVIALFPVWLLGAAVAYHRASIRRLLGSLSPTVLAIGRMAAAVVLAVVVLAVSAVQVNARVAEGVVAAATACLLMLLVDDVHWRGVHAWVLRTLSRYAHASYSLYAIHLPIIAICSAALVGRAEDRWRPDSIRLATGVAILSAIVLIARLFAGFTEFRTDRVRAVLLRGFRKGPRNESPRDPSAGWQQR